MTNISPPTGGITARPSNSFNFVTIRAQDGHEPILKKTRWCVLKRKSNLTSHQRFRLRDLLRYNIKTVRAYLLKEDFQQFWDYVSPTWAGKFLVTGAGRRCARASRQ